VKVSVQVQSLKKGVYLHKALRGLKLVFGILPCVLRFRTCHRPPPLRALSTSMVRVSRTFSAPVLVKAPE